jgi:NAD(P)H-hydrate epimerase
MNYVLTSREIKDKERQLVDSGISLYDLVRRAANAVLDGAYDFIDEARTFLVVVGIGGNAADGFCLAQTLYEEGKDVEVLEFDERANDIKRYFRDNYKGKIIKTSENKHYDLILDCIFGIGINRDVSGSFLQAIKYINKESIDSKVVSVDINSGLNSDNGMIMKAAVRSDLTVTFGAYKFGNLLNDGKDMTERLILDEIGYIFKKNESFAQIFDEKEASSLFPRRLRNSNKGVFKKVLIIGGSEKYLGAPTLSFSSLMPLLVGSGYSSLAIPRSLFSLYALRFPEVMVTTFKDDEGSMVFSSDDFEDFIKNDVIAFGMGLGVSEDVYKALSYLLKNFKGRLLIDADGINSLAKYGVDLLEEKSCQVILTPHIKEFSRLLDSRVDTVIEDSYALANEFAKKYGVTLVLKSSTTIVTDGQNTYLVTNGSPSLAKGGSGDTLSGIIAGMLTKEYNPVLCAACGSFLLGESDALALETANENSILASDVAYYLPKAIDKLKG